MTQLLKKYPIVAICLFVVLMLLPNLETLQVSIMEARNFVTAREMLSHDHWLLTTMNNVARYQKPPLPAWFSALSGSIFGIDSRFAMRLPAVFMVMLAGSFMHKLSRTALQNSTHSMINAMVLLTSFYVIGIVFEAPSDIFTHGFMLMSIYFLFKLFEFDETDLKTILFAGLFLGLSILAKGPISFYALLLPFLIAYGFSFGYKNVKRTIPLLVSALALGLLIGCSWYLYVKLQDPTTLDAIAKKETGTWTSYHTRPFYHYWSFVIQSGIWTIPAFISLLYPYLKNRVKHPTAYKFSFLWTVLAVVLLSLIPMKKARYLMPVLIPLAMNIGFYIEYLFREFKTMKEKRETIPVYFNFGLIGLVSLATPILLYVFLKVEFQEHLFRFSLASILLMGIGISMLYHLRAKNIKSVFTLTLIFFGALLVFVLPLTVAIPNPAYNSYANLKKELDDRQLRLFGLNQLSPEIIWDYGKVIPALRKDSNGIAFPELETFGLLLVTPLESGEEAKILESYSIKEVDKYDMNLFGTGKLGSGRLASTFYILEKKGASSDFAGFDLEPGDLLFQDSDCGPFCEAIEKVTFGVGGSKFSHVGMVVPDNDNTLVVIEAITSGVVETSLADFFSRSYDADKNSKVVVGRIRDKRRDFVPSAISFAKGKLGLPYDDEFDITNNKYYCSELIYESFKFANDKQPLFELQKMTYKDPDTKSTFPIWTQYFEELNIPIPENQPGLNPGGMSTSPHIDIVHFYGNPQGYKKSR